MRRVAERYAVQSRHYLDNAGTFMHKGDIGKASEFLWGSIAEAIKAIAASRGIILNSHERLREYAYELARELGDKSIRDTFYHAQLLHTNFYETELDLRDVRRIAEEIRVAVGKLLYLIPKVSEENKGFSAGTG